SRIEWLDAPRVERANGLFSADDVEGRPLLRRGRGEQEGPGRKVERGEAELAGHLGSGRPPAQASRDHQMQDQMQIGLEIEDDALSHATHRLHRPAVCLAEGRIERADEKRARYPDALERLADDPAPKVDQIDFD